MFIAFVLNIVSEPCISINYAFISDSFIQWKKYIDYNILKIGGFPLFENLNLILLKH